MRSTAHAEREVKTLRLLVSCGCSLGVALLGTVAAAKLPAPTDEQKAKSAEVAAKAAWTDKVSQYKTCLAQDHVVEAYQHDARAAGKPAPQPFPTAPCTNPGPYVATPVTPVTSKPLEASEAHSPAGAATSPPSTNAPHAALPK